MELSDIENILEKILRDEASENELKSFNAWKESSAENEKYFKQLQKIWNHSANYQEYKSINDHKAWQKIVTQMGNSKNRVGISRLSAVFKYAAIIIFAFVLGSTAMYFLNGNVKNPGINVFESYNVVSAPLGSKTQIELSDGTKVWLNAGTELKYPTVFSGDDRNVFLNGEAYFEVEKQNGAKFIVNANKIKVKVLGTKFNVKSYDEEGMIETTLVEGRVNLNKEGASQIVELHPGERATFIKMEGPITSSDSSLDFLKNKERQEQFIITKGVETDLITSWINNKLVFKRESFESLALKIERWHNVKIEIQDDQLKKQQFTGVFDKESVDQMMAALQIMIPFKYQINHNKITIYND